MLCGVRYGYEYLSMAGHWEALPWETMVMPSHCAKGRNRASPTRLRGGPFSALRAGGPWVDKMRETDDREGDRKTGRPRGTRTPNRLIGIKWRKRARNVSARRSGKRRRRLPPALAQNALGPARSDRRCRSVGSASRGDPAAGNPRTRQGGRVRRTARVQGGRVKSLAPQDRRPKRASVRAFPQVSTGGEDAA